MKRRAELRDLSDDHHRALVLARRLLQGAGQPADVRQLSTLVRHEYDRHLAPHFDIEERHLFPLIRAAGGNALAQKAEDDHAFLRGHVLKGSDNAATLVAFAERLRDHVRFEERVLFPFAEENLTDCELVKIARVRNDPDQCTTS